MYLFFRYVLDKRVLIVTAALLCSSGFYAPAVRAQEAVVGRTDASAVAWEASSRSEKIGLITAIIAQQKKKGITIRKEPGFYADQIDLMRRDDPALADVSIGTLLRTLVILYRDFDNGTDPEEMVRSELGDEAYQKSFYNKEAFEAIYQKYLKGNEEGKANRSDGPSVPQPLAP